MDWNKAEIFKGIDLNDSFVLSWAQKDNQLIFELEASVWPESIYYTKPNQNEYTCYRRGALEFVGLSEVLGLKPQESVASSTGSDGLKDYGNIDNLQIFKDSFLVEGDFGSVNIQGGELRFEIHT